MLRACSILLYFSLRRKSFSRLIGKYYAVKRGVILITAILRTIIIYGLIIVGLRLTGKRQIGQLEPIELVLTMMISDLASVPMQDFGIPLINGVIPIIVLMSLSTLLSYLSLRHLRFRQVVCGEPTLIIRDGVLLQDAMRHNRLTLDEVFEQLRSQSISSLNDVKYAVLETSGQLSFLLRSEQQPATPYQMHLVVEDEVFLPTILISDGRILSKNLKEAGFDEKWLQKQLDTHRMAKAKDVFLLTVDGTGTVTLIPKEKCS